MTTSRQRAVATGVLVIIGGLALSLIWATHTRSPDPEIINPGRSRGMGHWIGCLLEERGAIPRDPFRHVEG